MNQCVYNFQSHVHRHINDVLPRLLRTQRSLQNNWCTSDKTTTSRSLLLTVYASTIEHVQQVLNKSVIITSRGYQSCFNLSFALFEQFLKKKSVLCKFNIWFCR